MLSYLNNRFQKMMFSRIMQHFCDTQMGQWKTTMKYFLIQEVVIYCFDENYLSKFGNVPLTTWCTS